MSTSKGYIYILTNPSFPQYVKIGYADDVESRLNQLNRSECVPFAFRIYAKDDVQKREYRPAVYLIVLIKLCLHCSCYIQKSKYCLSIFNASYF